MSRVDQHAYSAAYKTLSEANYSGDIAESAASIAWHLAGRHAEHGVESLRYAAETPSARQSLIRQVFAQHPYTGDWTEAAGAVDAAIVAAATVFTEA